jgi:hypothetical protein
VQPPTADWGAKLDEGRYFPAADPLLALARAARSWLSLLHQYLERRHHQYLEPDSATAFH